MDEKQKLGILLKSKGKFITINDYAPYGYRVFLAGVIEYIDKKNKEITIRNLSKDSIRNIPLTAFNDFSVEPVKSNGDSHVS